MRQESENSLICNVWTYQGSKHFRSLSIPMTVLHGDVDFCVKDSSCKRVLENAGPMAKLRPNICLQEAV